MGSDNLAGVIMGIWNDRLIDKEWNMVLENNFYPNMLAIQSVHGGEEELNISISREQFFL